MPLTPFLLFLSISGKECDVGDSAATEKKINVDECNNLDEVNLSDMDGLRTGTYVRLEIHDVSFEIAENFDPCHPILVGGISHEEEKLGYLQVIVLTLFTQSTLPRVKMYA